MNQLYIYTHIPSLWTSLILPPPAPSHPSTPPQSSELAPCAIQQVPTNCLFHIWQCTYTSPNFPIQPWIASCPHSHSLHLGLYSCPANWFRLGTNHLVFGLPKWPSGKRIHLPTKEMQISSLGWEDPLEEEIRAWEIPWTEEPAGLQSIGSQRVRRD